MFFIDSKAKDCMWHSSFDNTDIISRGPIWDGSTFPRKSKKYARFFCVANHRVAGPDSMATKGMLATLASRARQN